MDGCVTISSKKRSSISAQVQQNQKENQLAKNEKKIKFLTKKYKTEEASKLETETKSEMPGLDCYKEESRSQNFKEPTVMVVEMPGSEGQLQISPEEIKCLSMQPGYMLLGDLIERT